MLEALNTKILEVFNTSTSPHAIYLRANSEGLFADAAPSGTDRPYIVFKNLPSSNSQTFCSNLDTCRVDFEVISDTSAVALELAWHIRKLYSDIDLELDAPYVNVSSLYNTTYQVYDSVNSAYVSIVAMNFYVQSPQSLTVIPINSGTVETLYTTVNTNSGNWDSAFTTIQSASGNWDITYTLMQSSSALWNSAFTTVQSASADWEAARGVNLAMSFPGAPFYDVPAGSPTEEYMLVSGFSGTWTGSVSPNGRYFKSDTITKFGREVYYLEGYMDQGDPALNEPRRTIEVTVFSGLHRWQIYGINGDGNLQSAAIQNPSGTWESNIEDLGLPSDYDYSGSTEVDHFVPDFATATYHSIERIGLIEGLATCQTPASAQPVNITMSVVASGIPQPAGEIVFDIGENDGVVTIIPGTEVNKGEQLLLEFTTMDPAIYGIQINILGNRSANT